MKIALLFLIVLVGVQSMTLMEKYPINFSQKRSIMTLLTQVENQLKTGGPLDAITKMLNDFKSTVNEEQANHDALWSEQQAECEDEISFRQEEVRNALAAQEEAQETLDGCTSQKVRAEADLKTTKKQLLENRSYYAQIQDTRRREAYAFETFTTAYQMGSRAIDEALVILDEIWQGEASFLQLTRHCNNLLKDAVKNRKAHLMTGVLSALAQLANKEILSDEQLVEKVRQLFLNLQSKMEAEFQEAVAAEQAAAQLFEEESARLEDTIASLESQELGLEAEIAELDKCIVTQSSIVAASSTKKDRNQRLLTDAENLCEAVAEEYKVASEARAEELELLDAIQERVEARFSELSDGVKARGKQDEFEYDAQYDYEDKEFKASQAE